MLRSLLVAGLVLAGAPRPAAAQAATLEEPLAGGVHAGAGASSWLGTEGDSLHLGAALGGFVTWRLTRALAVQAELSLIDKGADFESSGGPERREALLYLELPALARYDLPLTELASLYGVAGPGLALLVDSKLTPRQELRPFDLTATAGIGIDLYTPRHYVSFDLRARLGLIDAVDDDRQTARSLLLLVLAGITL